MTPTEFRALRRSLGLTQEQLAAHLGLTRRAIWCYETGRRPIPKQTALAMGTLREGGAPPPEPPTLWLIEGRTASGEAKWFPLAQADTRAEATGYKRELQAGAQAGSLEYIYRVRGKRLTTEQETT